MFPYTKKKEQRLPSVASRTMSAQFLETRSKDLENNAIVLVVTKKKQSLYSRNRAYIKHK